MLLLNQAVFVLDKPRSRLSKEYRKLVKALIKENDADRDGALALLRGYSDLYLSDSVQKGKWHDFDMWWEAGRLDNRINKITELFWDDPDILFKVAECRVLEGAFDLALHLLNRAVLIKADLAPALLQRALCKDRLGDVPGATADIFQYLQTKDLHPPDVLRSLRELAVISPDSLSEAIRLSSVQALDLKHKIEVGKIIASRRQALDIAINYLSRLLNDRDIADSFVDSLVDLLSGYFILSRRWQDAVDLITWATEATSSYQVCQVLSLNEMMARWGHTGELPEALCRWWLENADNEGNSPYSAPLLNQVNALALWRLGNPSKAREEIEIAIKWMTQHRRNRFSCWRYGEASPSEFLEDCQQIRRMIQGEPVRPAFLGEPTSVGKEGRNEN
jgi:tetratricopeptide (TPR) repeat protein